MIKLICAELFGRMCTVELPRWTSVDEMLETILNSSARPELAAEILGSAEGQSQTHGSVAAYHARVIEHGGRPCN